MKVRNHALETPGITQTGMQVIEWSERKKQQIYTFGSCAIHLILTGEGSSICAQSLSERNLSNFPLLTHIDSHLSHCQENDKNM